jgi:hypothetical protein
MSRYIHFIKLKHLIFPNEGSRWSTSFLTAKLVLCTYYLILNRALMTHRWILMANEACRRSGFASCGLPDANLSSFPEVWGHMNRIVRSSRHLGIGWGSPRPEPTRTSTAVRRCPFFLFLFECYRCRSTICRFQRRWQDAAYPFGNNGLGPSFSCSSVSCFRTVSCVLPGFPCFLSVTQYMVGSKLFRLSRVFFSAWHIKKVAYLWVFRTYMLYMLTFKE